MAAALRFFLPRTLNETLGGLARIVADELARLCYLGPLRSYPPRHLSFAQHHDPNWLASPDRLETPYELVVRQLVGIDQLEEPLWEGLEKVSGEGLSIEPDYDNEPTPSGAYPVIKDIEAEVERLKEAIQSSHIDKLQELILIDRRTNTVVSHRDVGIGISQVLPVLVLTYASNNRIIAMEQAEIHLHPALQAELGDVFIESALGERGNTFLLETHSEHLIMRILRRIRESTDGELPKAATPVKPGQVAVLFLQPGKKGAEVIHMPVTEDGEFARPWPKGFLPEREKELY